MGDGRSVARDLLSVGAVDLRPNEPFTWASGLLSPIYCDNRLTLGEPGVRRRLTDAFAERVKGGETTPDVVAGTATAGIPHAAWLADRLALPLIYVRSSAKEHGRGNRIEGRLREGSSVVLVEDTISTGGSALSAVAALREAGARVISVLAIFDYAFPRARAAFAEAGVEVQALATYDDLLAEARAAGLVTDDDLSTLARWRSDPAGWATTASGGDL
jgi:orotate phosphoribosyltransferase